MKRITGRNGLRKEQPGSQFFTVFALAAHDLDGPDKARKEGAGSGGRSRISMTR